MTRIGLDIGHGVAIDLATMQDGGVYIRSNSSAPGEFCAHTKFVVDDRGYMRVAGTLAPIHKGMTRGPIMPPLMPPASAWPEELPAEYSEYVDGTVTYLDVNRG